MKLFLSSIFLLFSMVTVYKIEKDFIDNPIFKIKEIEITGDITMVKDELRKLGSTLYNKNIWKIDVEEIGKKIAADVRIENSKVEFHEIGKVSIAIKEKDPIYYASINGESYLVDKNGLIFGTINETKIRDLPMIFVKDPIEILDIIKLFEKIKDDNLVQMVSQIYYENKEEINFSISDKTLIKTNLEVPDKKYLVLRELYLDLSKEEDIQYIDLRFDGYAVKGMGAEGIEKQQHSN